MADIADCLSYRKADATFKLHLLDDLPERLTRRVLVVFYYTHSAFGVEMSRNCMHQPHLTLLGHPPRPRAISCIQIWLQRLAARAVYHRDGHAIAGFVEGYIQSQMNVASRYHPLAASSSPRLVSLRLGIGSQPESALVSRDRASSDTDRQVAYVT